MLPVNLRLDGRVVAVVGGGSVGRRKALAAHQAGALVRVIDPRPLTAVAAGGMAHIAHIAEAYRADHLDGAGLVFACAARDVNARVTSDAKARGIWVNSATDPEACDFFLPAVLRRGDLTVAVSTGGAAPALARRLRDRFETELDPALADWVQLLNELRPQVLAAVADPDQRRLILEALADWPWLERLRSEGMEAVRQAMREQVRAGEDPGT